MLTLFQAALTAQNPLGRGIFKSIVTEDWMLGRVPFVPKEGDSFTYTRECILPSVEWVAPGATTQESAGYDQTIVVPKYEMSSDFDVSRFVMTQQRSTSANDPLARAIARKTKAAGRDFSRAIISGKYASSVTVEDGAAISTALTSITPGPGLNTTRQGPGEIRYTNTGKNWAFRAPGDVDFGADVAVATDTNGVVLRSQNKDRYVIVNVTVASITADQRAAITINSTSNEPDGLNTLIAPTQTRSSSGTNGDAISPEILDELIDMVKVRDNLAFIMNAPVRREFKAILRSAPGNTAETISIKGFNAQTGEIENQPILAYEGIPIFKNDYVLANETKGANSDLSSVYLASLSDDEGFHVGAFGGNPVELDIDPMVAPALGFELVDVGPVQNKNSHRWRLNGYTGFGLGSDLAAARATEIKSPTSA